jgi:hypothetical protein
MRELLSLQKTLPVVTKCREKGRPETRRRSFHFFMRGNAEACGTPEKRAIIACPVRKRQTLRSRTPGHWPTRASTRIIRSL